MKKLLLLIFRALDSFVLYLIFIYVAMFLFYILASCSVEKRANRKIDKAIILSSPKHVIEYVTTKYGSSYLETKIDTIVDTIFFRGIKVDTMFITKTKDTIIFQKDGTDVKIIRLYDTIYANIKSKTDTVYSVKTVTRYIVVKDKKQNNISKVNWIYIFIVFVIMFIAILILKK